MMSSIAMLHRPAALIASACAVLFSTVGCSSVNLDDAGPGDCSSDELVGRWHQTNSPPSWIREDITFQDDCGVVVAEYEGEFKSTTGWYATDGEDIVLDLYDWDDRAGGFRGDDIIELEKIDDDDEKMLVFERLESFREEASTLTSHNWRLVRYEWPDDGTVDQIEGGALWSFDRTFPSGGDLSIDGTGAGQWYLSGAIVGEWTLGVSYGIYLVLDEEGIFPFSYGVVSVDDSELVLHDDVGTGSNRMSVYHAE